MVTKGVKGGVDKKWKPVYLVQIYKLLKLGLPDLEVAKTLKVSRRMFYNWQKNKPEVKAIVAMVKKELGEEEGLQGWIYQRLSPELKDLWNRIGVLAKEEDGVAKVEAALQDGGKRARQQLFLYALCVFGFSPSKALRKVNITKKEFDKWVSNDPDFGELCEEIQWHKANFYEDSLITLVKQGNPAAVLFANKSFNKDRGYSSKSQLDINVSGSVLMGVMDLSELMPYLGESTKLEVLEAIRKRDSEKNPRILSPGEKLQERISYIPKPEEKIA